MIHPPDSETEDESQSLRWSQFPQHAIITAPVANHTLSQPDTLANPSTATVSPSPTSSSHSKTLSRPAPNPSPNKLHSHPPQPSASVLLSPTLVSTHKNGNAGDSTPRQAQRTPPSSSACPRTRQPVPVQSPDTEMGYQQLKEFPPKKYLKSTEGRRIPSDIEVKTPASRNQDKSLRKNPPSTSNPTIRRATPKASASPYSPSQSTSPYSRNKTEGRSNARGPENQKDLDNYKENEDIITIPNSARRDPTLRRNGKDKEEDAISKATPKGPLGGYMKYKGRGRYGKEINRGDEDATINEMYEIDPEQNAGLQFPFEEVVRGKGNRRRLIGGDCDDCREYYAAVGPMPQRLQPPLWKSPVKESPQGGPSSRPCPHHRTSASSKKRERLDDNESPFDDSIINSPSRHNRPRNASEISAHKQDISRHRALWETGNEPPGYWEIGFPSTQRADEINKDAREMERRKRKKVEEEAATEGGRYRRK
ncbi:hypothetical protein F5880DRAFT_76917 [Lentinula raphanica]|nr:hypothetical protein F5880DRAFT_76917 [Lentinula raphanica]